MVAALLITVVGCPFFQEQATVSTEANIAAASPTAVPISVAADDKKSEKTPAENLKPPDWFLLTSAEGDLDGDGKIDLVAVYSRDDPSADKQNVSEADGEAERRLIIALQGVAGEYETVFTSGKIVLCRNCGGMNENVEPEISVSTRKIVVEQNVLAASDVTYLLEVELKKERKFVVTKLTVSERERRTGMNRETRIKKPVALEDFDIRNY